MPYVIIKNKKANKQKQEKGICFSQLGALHAYRIQGVRKPEKSEKRVSN